MSAPNFAPGTSEADVFTLDTRAGRARLFNKRIDELMQTKNYKSIDDALHEMRTGGNPDDTDLLASMGESSSLARTEKLKAEKWVQDMRRLGDEVAQAGKAAPEVKAALKAANSREIAFNVRLDALLEKGFSIDQAINQMRANASDAALLKSMGAA